MTLPRVAGIDYGSGVSSSPRWFAVVPGSVVCAGKTAGSGPSLSYLAGGCRMPANRCNVRVLKAPGPDGKGSADPLDAAGKGDSARSEGYSKSPLGQMGQVWQIIALRLQIKTD